MKSECNNMHGERIKKVLTRVHLYLYYLCNIQEGLGITGIASSRNPLQDDSVELVIRWTDYVNLSRTKCYLLYLNTQSVPRSKLTPSRL